ncbi:MAG: AraC family transcriptional regulator [Eubacteriales bacterium]|nr:AraC family transcriptional regulator [Eubacteriales bacterium]
MENSVVLTLEGKESYFKELRLNFCGHSVCEPSHHIGPAAHPCYVLHYILDGKGTYQVDGRTYHLHKGEGFLMQPNVMSSYEADSVRPWTYIWIGFEGTKAKAILEQMGFSNHNLTYVSSVGSHLEKIVTEMLYDESNGLEQELFLQSQLFRFLSHLSRECSTDSVAFQRNNQHYYVRAAEEFIREHYAEEIKVQDIADHVQISRSYLTNLFQAILKTSPGDYLTHFRLTRAHEQLQITDDPIGTIANACGYRDPLVFSKAFKQMTGLTPTQFRKKARMEYRISIDHARDAKRRKY